MHHRMTAIAIVMTRGIEALTSEERKASSLVLRQIKLKPRIRKNAVRTAQARLNHPKLHTKKGNERKIAPKKYVLRTESVNKIVYTFIMRVVGRSSLLGLLLA